MQKQFARYEISIVKKNDESNQATVFFFDENHRRCASELLSLMDGKEFVRQIEKEKKIDIQNVCIRNFDLKALKKNKLELKYCKAKNVFFENEHTISLSDLEISAPEIEFTDCVFAAPRLNFSGTSFRANEISFENTCFFASELISFENAVFFGYTNFKHSVFSEGIKNFKRIRFPDKEVNFTDAEFKDGETNFTETQFGNGKNTFKLARFGNGKTDFSKTGFGKDESSFEKAEFGKGKVSFRSAVFKNGTLNFISVIFSEGKKDFSGTNFGNGDVLFKNTQFNDGKVSFRLASFGKGRLDFHFSEFGKGDLTFDNAGIDDGLIDFKAVHFGSGKVSFKRTAFGNGDIIFQAAAQEEGLFFINSSVLGKGEFNFEETDFSNADVVFKNVNFGMGKVSFKMSRFKILSLNGSQLDNYFDLRFASCDMLDLSDTVVKDIVDLAPYDRNICIGSIKLSGMRLLGRLYLDWKHSEIKKLIYQQKATHKDREEQFRILKENYSSTGQYAYEDAAYVEFKRCEAKAYRERDTAAGGFKAFRANLKFFSNFLLFDKMGKYATAPLRVLVSMLITYLFFSLIYIILAEFGDVHVTSSLFEEGDPRVLSQIDKAFYHSAITFLTIGYGDYYPEGISRWISSFEGFVGLFQMAYFTVAFARKALR